MDISAFRAAFPEFNDTSVYPTAMITFWSNVATQMVSTAAWKNMYATGVQLYVAHSLVLAAREAKGGGAGGAISSKSVGGVSVSYDTTSSTEAEAGNWNLTIYGKQYIRLARMFGAGAIVV